MQSTTKLDIRAIIAVSWLLSATALTWILFDKLGARGMLWMLIHHVFCIIGSSYELIRHIKQTQRSSHR